MSDGPTEAPNLDSRVLRLSLGVVAVGFILSALAYIVSAAPPFGFYYDLGVNIAATSNIDAAIHHWRDLFDALGWSVWDDGPQFSYNPLLTYLPLVLLSKLAGHDAWLAVKGVQVLEFCAAFAGMAALYAVERRFSVWALAAGVLYATLPMTTLQIRGNVDLGMVTALTPAALAVCFLMERRFGVAALPLCGVVAGLSGLCFAAEYFFFSTLPIYALVAVRALRNPRRDVWLPAAAAGLASSLLIGAYFIIPTLGARSLIADPAARLTVLSGSTQLPLFSEQWLALLALVPSEALVSPVAAFNATHELPLLIVPAALLWIAALAYLALAYIRRTWTIRESSAVAVSALCLFLALGVSVPLGTELWKHISAIPGLAYLRTPDRFIAVPFMLLALWCTCFAQDLFSLGNRRRLLAASGMVFIWFAFIAFGALEHSLSTEASLDEVEPALQAVDKTVAKIGGRHVSFAFVRHGSVFDFPLYGAGYPFFRVGWDLIGRYGQNGLGAAGILRKAAIRSAIATPNWTTDAPQLPDTTNLLDVSDLWQPAYASPEAVSVYALRRPVAEVSEAAVFCLKGGPGLLDRLLATPDLRDAAFTPRLGRCSRQLYADYDPRDDVILSTALWQRSGSTLFRDSSTLRDVDYTFVLGNDYLSDSWYRNAVDGDAPVFSATGVADVPPGASTTLTPLLERGDRYDLLIRAGTRQAAVTSVDVAGFRRQRLLMPAARGLQWYRLPLGYLPRGSVSISLRFDSVSPSYSLDGRRKGIAVDGVAVIRAKTLPWSKKRAISGPVAVSVSKFVLPQSIVSQPVSGGDSGALKIVSSDNIKVSDVLNDTGQRTLTASSGTASVNYRWNGQNGVYVVRVAAQLSGEGAMLGVGRSRLDGACCNRSAALNASVSGPTVVYDVETLHRGDTLPIRLSFPASDPNAGARLIDVRLVHQSTSLMLRQDETGEQVFGVDFTAGDAQLGNARRVGAVAILPNGAFGVPGSQLSITTSQFASATESAGFHLETEGDGHGQAQLECDGRHVAVPIRSPETDGAINGAALKRCSLRVSWLAGELIVKTMRIIAYESRVPTRRRAVWFPPGRFLARMYLRNGSIGSTAGLSIDGKAPTGKIDFSSAAYHQLMLSGTPANDAMLLFLPQAERLTQKGSLSVTPLTATSWRLSVTKKTAIELGMLSDRYWRLRGATINRDGIACDLIATCFVDVAPGTYRLYHAWPTEFKLGLLISLFVALFAVLLPFFATLKSTRR
jgi:hypothetical protein